MQGLECCLMVKLRGAQERRIKHHGYNVFSVRGAETEAVHGPLRRLSGAGSTEEACIPIFVNQSDELLNRVDLWIGLVPVPLQVCTEPEYSP